MELPSNQLTLFDALTLYQEQHLAARNLAPKTRKEYSADLAHFLAHVEGQASLAHIDQVRRPHLDRYLALLDSRGLKGSSRRRVVASLRSFFTFLAEQEFVPSNPAANIVLPMREDNSHRVLSEREYKRLTDAVRFHPRDAAIIELLLQTGIRLSECAGLLLTDITLPAKLTKDDQPGFVTVRGKGRKTRTITLNWKAARAVKAYLQVRPTVADPHLFITKFKKPLGPRSIENIASKYLQEAGIADASVHSLRHTFATHMVKKGVKLDNVRKALGHTNLKTTSIYIDLAREEMDKELQANAL